ncbi:ABC transporter B family member 27-like [Lytechinus variegatus]|uniref:ABC transporter B family member 27-like n=1 Tax=Lytechinus variegatus TaxID=7654 RepID=UPI001BB0FC2A|nr:ABC transporter B family member 27-like [Lytechinus variegatus]
MMAKVRYSMPFWRFSTFARFLVFLDGSVSLALWVTGGHTNYLESSVTQWTILGSTFELALLGLFKMLFLFYAFTKMEDYSLALLDYPFDASLQSWKKSSHIFTIFFSFLSLAYTTTKGGLVLNAILNNPKYELMHITYNILVISSVAFSFLELITSLTGPYFMRKLQIIRIEHRLNDEDEKKEKKESKADLGRVLSLAKPEVGLISLGMVGLIGSSASSMAAPLFFGKVVDEAVTSKSMDGVNRVVLILFLIFAGGAICSMVRSWSFTLAGMRVVCRLRNTLFAAIIRQEVAFFDTNRTGELTSRLSSDTQVVQNAVTVNISMLVRYSFQILGSIAIMFSQSASLTGVLLSVVPIIAIGAVQYGRYVQNFQKNFQDALGDAGTAAEEALSSIRTVRSFIGEPKAIQSYEKEIDKSYFFGKRISAANGVFNGIVGLVMQGAIALVLWYGGKLVHLNQTDPTQGISVGQLTSFMLYTLNVAMAFAFLSALYGDFMKAVGASERIFMLMDRKPEIPEEGGQEIMDFTGEISLEGVSFTYPSRPETKILQDVSFDVQPGQMVALVGPSGGGKSTIVNLLERFYNPDSGQVKFSGVDLASLDPKWFRQRISLVSQEPVLFACSIRDNIAYGRNATDDEIYEAAKMANAHDFVTGFEKGYDTLVGERGIMLSGGQKQRLAIARALIMDPTILLLDEATSALDAESEHLVQEAIDRAMVGRTVLVIAHRLSTVKHASQVIVIKKGKIAERGTHDELLNKGGVYKKLVLRQLSTGQGGGVGMVSTEKNGNLEDEDLDDVDEMEED